MRTRMEASQRRNSTRLRNMKTEDCIKVQIIGGTKYLGRGSEEGTENWWDGWKFRHQTPVPISPPESEMAIRIQEALDSGTPYLEEVRGEVSNGKLASVSPLAPFLAQFQNASTLCVSEPGLQPSRWSYEPHNILPMSSFSVSLSQFLCLQPGTLIKKHFMLILY